LLSTAVFKIWRRTSPFFVFVLFLKLFHPPNGTQK